VVHAQLSAIACDWFNRGSEAFRAQMGGYVLDVHRTSITRATDARDEPLGSLGSEFSDGRAPITACHEAHRLQRQRVVRLITGGTTGGREGEHLARASATGVWVGTERRPVETLHETGVLQCSQRPPDRGCGNTQVRRYGGSR